LEISAQDGSSSQPPGTALEPVPGTGLKLPIGPKVPDKITLQPDAQTLELLKKLLSNTPQGPQAVPITLPIDQPTSDRLSRILMILEWLLLLGGAAFGTSSVGKLIPLAARLVNGLQYATQAPSPTPPPTPADPSSPPANK